MSAIAEPTETPRFTAPGPREYRRAFSASYALARSHALVDPNGVVHLRDSDVSGDGPLCDPYFSTCFPKAPSGWCYDIPTTGRDAAAKVTCWQCRHAADARVEDADDECEAIEREIRGMDVTRGVLAGMLR